MTDTLLSIRRFSGELDWQGPRFLRTYLGSDTVSSDNEEYYKGKKQRATDGGWAAGSCFSKGSQRSPL